MFGATYAAIYDALYRQRPVDEDCDFVLELARDVVPRCRTLLDLGCGTGAHLAALAGRGMDCAGVERSEPMLDQARARLPARVPLILDDIRSVRLGRRFDVVVALFHVLSYMTSDDDLGAFYATASQHLAPGGVLIADFWYAPAVAAEGAGAREATTELRGRTVRRVARPRQRPGSSIIDVHYEIEIAGVERFEEIHSMRPFARDELEAAANAHDLELCALAAWRTRVAADARSWSAYLVATPMRSR